MKKKSLIALFICVFFAFGFKSNNSDLKSHVRFASVVKANELLTTEDLFTKSWSQFDIDSRLHKKDSKKEELFKLMPSQTREWTNEEKNKLNLVLDEIDKNITEYGFKINFPKEIFFIKTTTKEEGGADAYTRSNYVILKENVVSMSINDIKQTIVHELFHILTRNDNKFRKEMYKIIGFEIMNEISYPNNIKDYRITNPDATQTDSYIVLKKDDQPMDCMMILYSKSEYNGGDFFKYLNVGFLKLKGTKTKEIDYINGQAVIYAFNDVSNFFEQVGKNTQYTIHPEEILADNFTYAMDNKKGLPAQWIVDKIKDKLKE